MEHISCKVSQNNPWLSWKLKVHYHVHESQPSVPKFLFAYNSFIQYYVVLVTEKVSLNKVQVNK
jgi:hypothetical protein